MKNLVLICMVFWMGGCAGLRFEPGETQKQNAWLHEKTAAAAAKMAADANSSQQLQQLTQLSATQSEAFVAYYGQPAQEPNAATVEDLLSQSSTAIAQQATSEAKERPDVFDTADSLLELGIGIAGLFGGVFGTRVARFLQEAKAKSQAIQEIVAGIEVFKTQNAESAQALKDAQSTQSATTRQIVAALK